MLLISKLKTAAAVIALALAAGLLPLGAHGLWAQDRAPAASHDERLVDNGPPPAAPGTVLPPGAKQEVVDPDTQAFFTALSLVAVGRQEAVADIERRLAAKPALARAVMPSGAEIGNGFQPAMGIWATPLHVLANGGRFSPAIAHVADLLLAAGAPIDAGGTRSRGWTPLMLAGPEFGDYLIAHGAKPTLAWHAKRGDLAQVKTLLASDRKLARTVGAAGATPLHFAAAAGSIEICEALVKAGADPDALDANGTTPVRWAIAAANRGVEQDPHQVETLRATAAWLAAHGTHWDLVSAVGADDAAVIAKLLARDPGAANRTEHGVAGTPLILAVRDRHPAAARALLDHGADANALGGDGMTALHWAAMLRDAAMVRVLIDGGADPTRRDAGRNQTPREWMTSVPALNAEADRATLEALDAPRPKR